MSAANQVSERTRSETQIRSIAVEFPVDIRRLTE